MKYILYGGLSKGSVVNEVVNSHHIKRVKWTFHLQVRESTLTHLKDE